MSNSFIGNNHNDSIINKSPVSQGATCNIHESFCVECMKKKQVITYSLSSLKKYDHKPKRAGSNNDVMSSQNTKIDSITTFQREGNDNDMLSSSFIFQNTNQTFQAIQQQQQQQKQAGSIKSFCFTSEPRGGIVTFQNRQGFPYTNEQLQKVILIQRKWREAYSYVYDDISAKNHLGGIVYLPKDFSRFRSYSEQYDLCFDSKENMDPIKIKRLEPTYITKDNNTNYEEHVEKFVGSQFKLRSAPKIQKAKATKQQNNTASKWNEESVPIDSDTFNIIKDERIYAIESQIPLTIEAKSHIVNSIGCNTINWTQLNKLKSEIDLMLQKKERIYSMNSFNFDLNTLYIPWRNKPIEINTNEDSRFMIKADRLRWKETCQVTSSINQYNHYKKPIPMHISNYNLFIKHVNGFHKHKLFSDNSTTPLLNIIADNPLSKCIIESNRNIIHISNDYPKPINWNKINQKITHAFTVVKSKRSWHETNQKMTNDLVTIDSLYPRHIWNLLNQHKQLASFSFNKPKQMFFSISSHNYIDYNLKIGTSEKNILHTLTKRDIMYLWNKCNQIEAFDFEVLINPSNNSEDLPIITTVNRKMRKCESIYTLGEQINVPSDEDDDEMDKIIAICQGEKMTLKCKSKKKVTMYPHKRLFGIENVGSPESNNEEKEEVVVPVVSSIINHSWNSKNSIDNEGMIDIFIPGENERVSMRNCPIEEYQCERQAEMDVMIISNMKRFDIEVNNIQSMIFDILAQDIQNEPLSPSNLMFSIHADYPKFGSFIKKPTPSCLEKSFDFTIEGHSIHRASTSPHTTPPQLTICNTTYHEVINHKTIHLDIMNFAIEIEGNSLPKAGDDFSIGNIEEQFPHIHSNNSNVNGSIEELIVNKWNKDNILFTNSPIALNQTTSDKNLNMVPDSEYTMTTDIIFSLMHNTTKRTMSRTKWDAKIFPVQAQYYKVIGQKSKWVNLAKIANCNLQVLVNDNGNELQMPSRNKPNAYSLRDSFAISNEFFELLTLRSYEEPRSPKSHTDEMKGGLLSTIQSQGHSQQLYTKPLKKIIHQSKNSEADVQFLSNSKPSDIFISSFSQYKSNGKKQSKPVTKKINQSSDGFNGITALKPKYCLKGNESQGMITTQIKDQDTNLQNNNSDNTKSNVDCHNGSNE